MTALHSLPYRGTTAFALFLLVAAFSGTASAQQGIGHGEDDKGLTGAQCQPSNGAQWDQFLVFPRGIKNISATGKYISCTIDTDAETTWGNTYNAGGVFVAGSANLHLVFDYTAGGGTTTCTAFLTEDNGTVHTHANSVSGSATPVRKFMTISGMTEGSAENAPMAFNCLMPAGVVLTNINLAEIQDSDNKFLYTSP